MNNDGAFTLSKQQRLLLKLPMKLIQIYLTATVLLYAFGPFEWPSKNKFLLYTFLFLSQTMLILGYNSALKKRSKYGDRKSINTDKTVTRYLKVAITINLIFVILNTIRNMGLSSFSLETVFSRLIAGFTNPGKQYKEKFSTAAFGGPLLTHVTVIISPLLWPVLPLSLYYFKNIGFLNRILVVITLFFEVTRWVAVGTNKGIIDLIITICAVILVKNLQARWYVSSKPKKRADRRPKMYFLIGILICIGLTFFSHAISSRIGGRWEEGFIFPINKDSIFIRFFPDSLKPTMVYITSYLAQGYYALSLALTEPFIPMFGVGNSMFLIENFQDLLGIDLFQYTYQARIAYLGWHPLVNWHSIYVWIANDIHFIGVIPLMYFLGRFFGNICKDTIVNRNPIAFTIFCLLINMFFYFPANNQILSYPTTFMAFWGLSIYWILRRKIRFRWRE